MATNMPSDHMNISCHPTTDPRSAASSLQPVSKLLKLGTVHLPVDEAFDDGLCNGWASYTYRNSESLPTWEQMTRFIFRNSHDPRASASWNAGHITGWLMHVLLPGEEPYTIHENIPESNLPTTRPIKVNDTPTPSRAGDPSVPEIALLQIAKETIIPAHHSFRDGYASGWIDYWYRYHEQVQISSETITHYIVGNAHHHDNTPAWNAGHIISWLACVLCPDASVWETDEEKLALWHLYKERQPAVTIVRKVSLGAHTLILYSDRSMELLDHCGEPWSYLADNAIHLPGDETYRLLLSLQDVYR